jgi:glyoxylase-like metal-dependent hydrolase (beta-lactamase superfamily II)
MKNHLSKLGFCLALLIAAGLPCCKDTENMEKITVINGAMPVYKFTIPKGDSLENYTKFSAQFLVDAENYRKQARVRAYGVYPRDFFTEQNDIVFLDFNGNDTDRNGPYLLSNVLGTERSLRNVSRNAGAGTWFTLEFPLRGKNHPNYNSGNFPPGGANGDFYFAFGINMGNASASFTYYVKEVALLNDDGGKKIMSSGSGFDKPAFIGYQTSITELRRAPAKKIDPVTVEDDFDDYYRVRQIYPWLYSIFDPQNVYCYLLIGEEKALLFDTVFGIGSLPKVIKKITDKPVTVALGHGHNDHVNGAYQFNEVWLHEDDFNLCYQNTSVSYRRGIIQDLVENGEYLPDGFDIEAYINAGAGNLKKLAVGQIFDLGGLSIEVIDMAGHTQGSIGILAREHRVLLDSDSANPNVYMFFPESTSVSRYAAMLERVIKLDFDTFFIAHSDVEMPKSDFQRFINAARNATPEKSTPFYTYDMKAWSYQEDGMQIVFDENKY